ncbi:DNA replication complex GINS protein PSF2 [Colletotrichum plurivorum]|uniref:DNA replication complex GINS protein PSF2 n=1 Tax=Colletotrichum plurivorum TaxID=2175906 RepID=A0A8H6NIM5_9PEZI|nr:DNA replication complex GINS protein PSF2 [Colletotrichum plurivorum]
MALPLPPGLVPAEVAFLCEMELVTIVPRQRLESIDLLSVSPSIFTPRRDASWSPTLTPPARANLPLWLALLLKKQRRANIVPPSWLHPTSLAEIVHQETNRDPDAFSQPPPPPIRADGSGNASRYGAASTGETVSAPFLPSCTAEAPPGALPYHWFELAEMLLAHAADDVPSSAEVRSLLRDLQEVRSAKLRRSTEELGAKDENVMSLRGVGAMELAESRGFFIGVMEGVRKIGASAEMSRREEEEERGSDGGDYDEDEDML